MTPAEDGQAVCKAIVAIRQIQGLTVFASAVVSVNFDIRLV